MCGNELQELPLLIYAHLKILLYVGTVRQLATTLTGNATLVRLQVLALALQMTTPLAQPVVRIIHILHKFLFFFLQDLQIMLFFMELKGKILRVVDLTVGHLGWDIG